MATVERLTMQPVWLTKAQAAEIAQVSVWTISRWIRQGHLKAGGGPGVVRIRRDWLDQTLENGHKRPK